MEHLKKLIKEAELDFSKCKSLSDLDHTKAKYLGKTGPLTEAMRSLSGLSKEEKPKIGAFINEIKKSIEVALLERKKLIQDKDKRCSGIFVI